MNLKSSPSNERDQEVDFETASKETPDSFLVEFFQFLRESKKWWLTPIAIVLGLLAIIVILGSSPAAPFIYSLF